MALPLLDKVLAYLWLMLALLRAKGVGLISHDQIYINIAPHASHFSHYILHVYK